MDTSLSLQRNFDMNSRNSPGTREIKDRGGTFFMLGDSRLALYDAVDRTLLRYWNEKTSVWESTWDDIIFPVGSKFLGTVNSRRGLMGAVNQATAEIVEVHPFYIHHIDADGSMQIDKQPILHFQTPIRSVHLSFDTDYLFALSGTHIYYWNADTPSTLPVRECTLRNDYRGVPLFARGSILYFLYDGNAETMDEFDGSSGEWSRWSLGHNYDGLLPNLSGLRGPRRLAIFSVELISVFAVSIADNSLWSLDVNDLFWKLLGNLDYDGTPVEIVSADGRTVFVRAGEEIAAVTIVPDYNETLQDTTTEVLKENEEDEETKLLRTNLEEARAKRASQLSKLRKIGVMLLQSGVDQKILNSIESGFDKNGANEEEDDDPHEKMRLEIESILKSEPLYKKKLMKYMTMISHTATQKGIVLERREETAAVDHASHDGA